MAVTSIWPIKGSPHGVIEYVMNPEKTSQTVLEQTAALHAIGGVVEYAADQIKTEECRFITGINVDVKKDVAKQFLDTKGFHGKFDGRLCYHGYQSFAAGEVTAETAHAIGVALAEELWGGRFEVVVATHCNTGHFHNHFVINSVSCVDGLKFYNLRSDYTRMREVSDRLCREYNLSVIESSKRQSKSYGEWRADKEGRPTLRSMIRADIDRAILASTTDRDFLKVMMQMGYDIQTRTETGAPLKYPKLKPPDTHGYFRFHKLGEGYSLNEIRSRILGNIRKQVPFPEADASPGRRYRCKNPLAVRKVTGLRALYFYYCYELHSIVRHPTKIKRVSHFLREDIIKLSKLDAQTLFLGKNRIGTMAELGTRKAQAEAALGSLLSQRKALRNQLRRCLRHGQTDQADTIQADISSVTGQLSAYRKEIQMCNEIAQRSIAVETNLTLLRKQQEKERKESEVRKAHELFRRRS